MGEVQRVHRSLIWNQTNLFLLKLKVKVGLITPSKTFISLLRCLLKLSSRTTLERRENLEREEGKEWPRL